MKGIFCHDLWMNIDVNGIYCSSTMTNAMFARYFQVVDELIVATRIKNIDVAYEDAHQEKVDLPGISYFSAPNLMSAKGFLFERLQYKNKLKKVIKQCDMVFVRGGEIANLAAEICVELGKPYLLEVSGGKKPFDLFWNHGLKGKLIAPIMAFRTNKTMKNASYALFVSKLACEQSTIPQKTYASDVVIDTMDEILERRIARLNTLRERDIIFTIGTTAAIDAPYKGHEYIIRAMSKLKEQGIMLKYELVGGGDRSRIDKLAKIYGVETQVVIKGEMNHAEVLAWLENIDIYAQPSLTEGLPRAVVEAISRACIAIGTNVDGIPELVREDLLFPAKDVNKIVEILLRLCNMQSEELVKISRYYFEKTKEYLPEILAERRNLIFEQYAKVVREGNNNG